MAKKEKELNYMHLNDLLIKEFGKAENQAKGKKRTDRFFVKIFLKNRDLINRIYRDIYIRVKAELLEKFTKKANDFIKEVKDNDTLKTDKNKVAYLIYHYKLRYGEALLQPKEKRQAYLMGTVCLSIIAFKHFLDQGNFDD